MTPIAVSQLNLTSKEGWQKWKLAHAFNLIGSGTTPPTGAVEYFQGKIPWVNTGDLNDGYICSVNKFVSEKAIGDFSALKIFPKNSLIIALYGATIGKLGILQIDACTNQACCILAEPNHLDTKFVFYWLMSERNNIIELAQGGGQPNISQEIVKNLRVPAPNITTQKTIAHFLDRKTAAIATLIAKKQRLIQLLEEKRTALINQAVTKGLNPNAPMKDSGIPWIGEIPEHWDVMAIKYLARPGRKTFIDGDWVELPYITEEGIRLIQTGNVGIGNYREKGFKYIAEESFLKLNCTEVEPNNVLICRLDGPVGRACLVPDLGVRMITSVDNTILKPDAKHDARFIVYLLSCKPYLEWNQALCRVGGGHRWRVSRSMLGDLRVPVPPEEEQQQTADFLDEKTAQIISTIDRLLVQIEKLQEYRRSLITAAVTGRLDINTLEQEI